MIVPEKNYLFRVVMGSGAGCGEDLQLECCCLLCLQWKAVQLGCDRGSVLLGWCFCTAREVFVDLQNEMVNFVLVVNDTQYFANENLGRS